MAAGEELAPVRRGRRTGGASGQPSVAAGRGRASRPRRTGGATAASTDNGTRAEAADAGRAVAEAERRRCRWSISRRVPYGKARELVSLDGRSVRDAARQHCVLGRDARRLRVRGGPDASLARVVGRRRRERRRDARRRPRRRIANAARDRRDGDGRRRRGAARAIVDDRVRVARNHARTRPRDALADPGRPLLPRASRRVGRRRERRSDVVVVLGRDGASGARRRRRRARPLARGDGVVASPHHLSVPAMETNLRGNTVRVGDGSPKIRLLSERRRSRQRGPSSWYVRDRCALSRPTNA